MKQTEATTQPLPPHSWLVVCHTVPTLIWKVSRALVLINARVAPAAMGRHKSFTYLVPLFSSREKKWLASKFCQGLPAPRGHLAFWWCHLAVSTELLLAGRPLRDLVALSTTISCPLLSSPCSPSLIPLY